jgi:hypothetical protein
MALPLVPQPAVAAPTGAPIILEFVATEAG